ncbi:bile acid:sodium symporter family protein [Adhaeribacter terreus]|uniref:Bile acid:sodium symporter family protein n=1 Tax=Adhaeribacter terreus TaxID=529703 RepID=A0ABW0E7K5_9BACT
MNAVEIITLILKISIFLTALGYGLKTTAEDAFYLFRNPGLLLRSILAMNIIMPVVAILMALLFNLPPLVKVALLAISVSPLAPLFPKKTSKAGGRQGYALGLMLVASMFCILLIPVTLEILARIFKVPVEVNSKALIITALVSVIIPLISGIAAQHFAPAFADKISNPVSRIALILLIVSALPVLVKMFPAIVHLAGNGTALAIAGFVILGVCVGHFLGNTAEKDDRSVLALATASRHPAIAISVASANMPDHHLVPAAILLYLLINAIVTLPYLKWLQKNKPE